MAAAGGQQIFGQWVGMVQFGAFMMEAGTGFTDASGRRWGGFIRSVEGKFEAAADFEAHMHMLSYISHWPKRGSGPV